MTTATSDGQFNHVLQPDQTFLIGETIYLRGFIREDAKDWFVWSQSPFPSTTERAAEVLEETVQPLGEGDLVRLIAVDRQTDEPVGGVQWYKWDFRAAWLNLAVDPARPDDERDALWAAMLGLLTPWLQQERDQMVIWLSVPDPERPRIASALAETGYRPAYALREHRFHRGARQHNWLFEAFHPSWLTTLGDPWTAPAPPPALGYREAAAVRFHGAPLTGRPAAGERFPKRAILVGPRVYLRPLEPEDGGIIADWSRRETEHSHQNGRTMRSPIAQEALIRRLASTRPPEWIRLGIASRETDELIGMCGVMEIDWLHRTGETESDIFDPARRGGGLGTEAKHLLIDFCFDHLNLHALKSYVWTFNPRSQAALLKQGYRHAGRMHWVTMRHGAFQHDDLFDLLADEWRAAKEAAMRNLTTSTMIPAPYAGTAGTGG